MSQARRIARNTSFLTISQIISFGVSAIYVILVARYLGPQGLGILNFAVALTAIFNVLTNFGLPTLITREVARDRSKASKYAANVVPILLLLTLTSVGLIIVLVNALGYSQQTIYVVYILSIGMVVSTLSSVFLAIFQAFEQLEFQSIVTVIGSIVPFCAAVIAILLHMDVIAFALISLLASVVVLAYVYATCVSKFFVPRLEADFTFWKKALTEAWPMAALAVTVIVLFRIDTVMLSLIQGTTAVGFYSVAYNLSEASLVIPIVFTSSIYPVLSKLHRDSKQSFRETCAQATKYLLYLALPMAFFVTLWAKPIVSLLYGANFDPSVAAVQILIWSAAIMFLSFFWGTAYVAANLQKLSLKINLLQTALNISLNVFLIPKYSYIGASFATVVAVAFGFALDSFFLQRNGFALGLRRTSLAPVFGLAGIVAISNEESELQEVNNKLGALKKAIVMAKDIV